MAVPYLSLPDIAKLYNVSPRTARRWAAHDRWRRKGSRPVRYSVTDAQASYDRHKHGRVARHLVKRHGNGTHGAVQAVDNVAP